MWVCIGCGGIISCCDWHTIVLLFPLHITCNFESYAAHRTPPLSAVAARSSSIRRHLTRISTVHVEPYDTMRSCKAQCKAPPDNHETGGTYHSRESRSCAGEKIEHQNRFKKRHSSSSAGMYNTSEADFHKPGIYGGSVRVWATVWDVFRRAPSRVGRGVLAAVDFVVCFGWGGFFFVFCFRHLASCTSLLVMRPFLPLGKKYLQTGVRTGRHFLISLSVCVCMCV